MLALEMQRLEQIGDPATTGRFGFYSAAQKQTKFLKASQQIDGTMTEASLPRS